MHVWECVGEKKTELKRGDRAITIWKVNTVLGNPLSLSREGGRLRLFIFHLEMETEEQRGDPQWNY